MIKPYNGRLLVRPLPKEEKSTASGIILNADQNEKCGRGEIVVGTMSLPPGTKIVFSKFGFDETDEKGETFYLVSEESIVGIIE